MRGPFGSLIRAAQQELFQKALPPSLFAKPWRAATVACHMPDDYRSHFRWELLGASN